MMKSIVISDLSFLATIDLVATLIIAALPNAVILIVMIVARNFQNVDLNTGILVIREEC